MCIAPAGVAAQVAIGRIGWSVRRIAGPRLTCVFGFFSSNLGCIGSIIVSIVGSLLLMLILRGCGS